MVDGAGSGDCRGAAGGGNGRGTGPGSRLDALNVEFAGSLVGTTSYTTQGSEVMRGSVHRFQGGEQQDATGVSLTAQGQGVMFESSGLSLGTGTASQGFVAEVELTPKDWSAKQATVFSAGGNLFVRSDGSNLEYGWSSKSGSTWSTAKQSIARPSQGQRHVVSIAYLPDQASGSSLHLWLDGKEQPTVSASTREQLTGGLESTFGFGNEVNPSGRSRTVLSTLHHIRVAQASGSFAPSMFEFQDDAPSSQVPCSPLVEITPGKQVAVDKTDCEHNIMAKAAAVRPTEQQQAWQEDGLTAFVHFGINTFHDQEWGNGSEDPAKFQPTGTIDPDAWVRTLREAGFRQAILVVKHHDGFVGFPSRYTDYDISATPWKNGKGDLVREFTDAAHRYGMLVGLYMSPADSHEEKLGVFGNGSAKTARTIPTLVPGDDRAASNPQTYSYQATDYGAYFLNTLYEMLTQYGTVDEVWFDGAQGNTVKDEHFDYAAFFDLIHKLQPNAVVAVGGRDVRWVGNELGQARPDEWAVVPVKEAEPGGKLDGIKNGSFDLTFGHHDQVIDAVQNMGATSLNWWPSEGT